MTAPMNENHGGSVKKSVWLTFDDGPHPEFTSRILDVLSDFGIGATFFVLGSSVSRVGRAVLERMGREGHFIGNHGYSHQDLTTLTEAEVRDDVRRGEEMLAGLPNFEKIFRPPYGACNEAVDRIINRLGYRRVLWNVDTRDWDPAFQPDGWVDRAISLIHERRRSVVIAHDIHRSTADHVGTLIKRAGDVAFRPMTICRPGPRSPTR